MTGSMRDLPQGKSCAFWEVIPTLGSLSRTGLRGLRGPLLSLCPSTPKCPSLELPSSPSSLQSGRRGDPLVLATLGLLVLALNIPQPGQPRPGQSRMVSHPEWGLSGLKTVALLLSGGKKPKPGVSFLKAEEDTGCWGSAFLCLYQNGSTYAENEERQQWAPALWRTEPVSSGRAPSPAGGRDMFQ